MDVGSLKEDLAKAIEGEAVCLYWSGGADSTYLLHVLIDLQAKFSIVCFDQSYSPEQTALIDRIVNELGLVVFSYPPDAAFLVGDGEQIALVEEYKLIDGTRIPFIRDCVGGSKCSFDIPIETRPNVELGFTLHLLGTRKTDEHWTWGSIARAKEIELPTGRILFPLWDLTREQVIEGLKDYGVEPPEIDTGDFQACVDCLKGSERVFCPKKGEEIDRVDWQPRAMLEAFQGKYGVKTNG